jgi:hypothetical protein
MIHVLASRSSLRDLVLAGVSLLALGPIIPSKAQAFIVPPTPAPAPRPAPAPQPSAAAGGYVIASLSNGALMLGPQGSISYCSPFLELTAAGSERANITAAGECILIASKLALPTTDMWVIAPVVGSNLSGTFVASAYLLDETSGSVIECSTAETPIGTAVYLSGNCVKLSPNLTP